MNFKNPLILLITTFVIHFGAIEVKAQSTLPSKVKRYLRSVEKDTLQIPEDRKQVLQETASHIISNSTVKLHFVCSHNSRRSQMAQLITEAIGQYYNINIEAYSGGTHATALNPRAAATLQRVGFDLKMAPGADIPQYSIQLGEETFLMYSKKYDDMQNPKKDFIAIMVCSEADRACPIIPGATLRVALPYTDPRKFDGTEEEEKAYDIVCKQIARDLIYLMAKVKSASL
ncbi:protein-tyrosine-phosphatase [Limibacter armeniacum]|uniref:arsenate reductase/protein-tyrosine-phosphatase family protein n=1 Tax=Limibacter armeniacum TaxID=466084 RepID=UPI002FE58A9A